MSFATDTVNGLKEFESLLDNQVFTWDDQDYVCIPFSPGEYLLLSEGGFTVNLDLIIKVRKALFLDGVFPQAQQTLTYKDVNYRIYKVTGEATQSLLTLMLTSTTKGI